MKKFKKSIKFISVALIWTMLTSFSTTSFYAVSENKTVYIGGDTFGVKFYANGVIITQLEDYFDGSKYVCPARSGGLQESDIIKEVNGYDVNSNEELKSITEQSEGKILQLKIERNGKEIDKQISPIKNTVGIYLIGAWVRDSCAGIGTITYYDDDNNYFAALGHGICDNDTQALMPLASGQVLHANVSGIDKSVVGKAGSLNGYFTDNEIGKLTKNTELGVFGTINDNMKFKGQEYEIANRNEIKTGKAQLYTTIENSSPKFFDIEIKRICNNSKDSNENFIIKITDKKLIDECGGILQGMSGSPIIQNGKIVGAVTHVFVNNPKEGYGVFLQNMVDYYKK